MCKQLEMRVLHTLFFMDLPNYESSRCSWHYHSRLVPWRFYVLFFFSIDQATERKNGHGSSDRLEIGFDEGGLAFFVFNS